MKLKYRLLIYGFAFLFLLSCVFILFFEKEYTRLNYIIQLCLVFAAIFSSVIALALSDKEIKEVSFDVHVKVLKRKDVGAHRLRELSDDLKDRFRKLAKDDIFYSHKVVFTLANKSGFTLKNPVVKFRLPMTYRHPLQVKFGVWTLVYDSNIHDIPGARSLEFGNTMIVSNDTIPTLENNEDVQIWFRMCLDETDQKPFKVRISLLAENAEGISKVLEVVPLTLFTSTSD